MDRNADGTQEGVEAAVALLAEGVDRNLVSAMSVPPYTSSPSSRRAWIEIILVLAMHLKRVVALLAEGVDRNINIALLAVGVASRPPRGGRG